MTIPTAARPSSEAPTELGEGEGEVNLVAWAGYVEDGSTDPKVDWVTDFEKETGCQVNVKIGNTSDEMVQLMRTGAVRRGLGLRRRDDPPDRGRRRRPGQHRPDPQLRGRLRRAQGSAVQLASTARCTASRTAAARTCSCTTRPRSSRRPTSWDVVFDNADRVQRPGDRLRQPDLHRRRGAVPARAPAGPRDHGSVRARPGAVRRGDRAAQAAERAHRRVLVRLHEGDPARSRTATPRSAPPGR